MWRLFGGSVHKWFMALSMTELKMAKIKNTKPIKMFSHYIKTVIKIIINATYLWKYFYFQKNPNNLIFQKVKNGLYLQNLISRIFLFKSKQRWQNNYNKILIVEFVWTVWTSFLSFDRNCNFWLIYYSQCWPHQKSEKLRFKGE